MANAEISRYIVDLSLSLSIRALLADSSFDVASLGYNSVATVSDLSVPDLVELSKVLSLLSNLFCVVNHCAMLVYWLEQLLGQ